MSYFAARKATSIAVFRVKRNFLLWPIRNFSLWRDSNKTGHRYVTPAVICWRTMGGDLRGSAIRASMADLVSAVTGLHQSGRVDVSQALKNLEERLLGCDLLPQTR